MKDFFMEYGSEVLLVVLMTVVLTALIVLGAIFG